MMSEGVKRERESNHSPKRTARMTVKIQSPEAHFAKGVPYKSEDRC